MSVKSRLRKTQAGRTNIITTYRYAAITSACILTAALVIFLFNNLVSHKKVYASLGMHGAKTISAANTIVNEFTTLTSNASAGSTQINVTNSSLNTNGRFSGSLAAGELVMIIQMQGATINSGAGSPNWGAVTAYNNAGNYEFAEVLSIPSSTKIQLTTGLKKSYTVTGKVQVIRVPRYSSLVINSGASLTTDLWNGSTGGVCAIEVNGTSTINGTINVNGLGFRGGVVKNTYKLPGNHTIFASATSVDAGEKGEGIAGFQADYDAFGGRYGRGAPANGGGGGNSHNASGGGGANTGLVASWDGLGNPDNTNANWTTAWNLESASFSTHVSSGGGRGGYSYSQNVKDPLTVAPLNALWGGDSRYNVGGYGGRPLDYSTGRIYLGGGGGAGDSNDGTGTSGAAGGGIFFLLNGKAVSGTGSINARGADAGTTAGPNGWDGTGGGGGGGTVMIYTPGASVTGISINANGGTGGSQINIGDPEAEGTGGGGGGGYISITNGAGISKSVAGGIQGTTNSSTMTNFTPNGGTRGGSGLIVPNPSNPYTFSSTPLPVELLSFEGKIIAGKRIEFTWVTASEINNDYFVLERSKDGINFQMVAKVNGAGTSSAQRFYEYVDRDPSEGDNFYRLQQTDYDGKTSFLNNLHFKISNSADGFEIVAVNPNPFSKFLEVKYASLQSSEVQIKVFNLRGQLVASEISIAHPGRNNYQILNTENLENGIYLIKLFQNNEQTKSLMVIRH